MAEAAHDFFNLIPEALDPARAHLPLMLLDIDGVLNATHQVAPDSSSDAYDDKVAYTVPTDDGRLFPFWTSPSLIAELLDLHESGAVEIAWLTTWQYQANRHVAPILGLPQFPVVADSRFRFSDYYWKQRAAVEALKLGRPIIWIDDTEIVPKAQKDYEKSEIPHLLIAPDPALGLTRTHLAEIRAFLASPEAGE